MIWTIQEISMAAACQPLLLLRHVWKPKSFVLNFSFYTWKFRPRCMSVPTFIKESFRLRRIVRPKRLLSGRVKHLGNMVTNNGSDGADLKLKSRDMVMRSNGIKVNFNMASHSVKCELFRSYCCAFYGSQCWWLDEKNLEEMAISWRKCARHALGLPYRTRSHLLPTLSRQPQFQWQVDNRFVSMIRSIRKGHNESMLCPLRNSTAEGSFIGRNINIINSRYNVDIMNLARLPPPTDTIDTSGQISLLFELLDIRDGNMFLDNFDMIDISSLIDTVACI